MILRFPEFSRDMRRGDEAAVDSLLAETDRVAVRRVAALRRSGRIAGETVLPWQGEIVGYYALAGMEAPEGCLCLAALAIAPDWQGAGHGRRLIGMLSEWARLSGRSVVARGPGAFLERAGFVPMEGAGLYVAGPAPEASALVFPPDMAPRA
ncbi:GNAT family N-acetyltransferase [Roseovarius aquimarinus]|uniref:GNAT family N-acetyltransferase n=1 Tax=Roseovarius aquimarinus TaxID=1229156 RepID=A0ABW7I894_9RHOB